MKNKEKKEKNNNIFRILDMLLTMLVVTCIFSSIVGQYHNFWLRQDLAKSRSDLMKDVSSRVGACLDKTFHDQLTEDNYFDGKKTNSDVYTNIPVEQCEKVRDVMLSIIK